MCGSRSRDDKLTRPQIHTDNGRQKLHHQRRHNRPPPVPGSVPRYLSSPHPPEPYPCAWHSSFDIYQHHLLVLHLTPVLLSTIINFTSTSAISSYFSIRLLVSYFITATT